MSQTEQHCHFTVMVGAAPGSAAASLALRFVAAAGGGGHQVDLVFFYHDGVRVLTDPAAQQRWKRAAAGHGADLVVCVAATDRRTALNDKNTLPEPFRMGSLAQWLDASLCADRVVQFGPVDERGL